MNMLFRPKVLGGHVHVRVFVNRAMSGVLVMTLEEWHRLTDTIDTVDVFTREEPSPLTT